MSGTHWAAIIGTVGGVIGTGGGVTSAIIAGMAKRDSHESAKEARDSANEAAKVSRIEADRQHETLKPGAPAKIEASLRDGTLWGSITVKGRDYLVSAVGIDSGGGERQLEVPRVLRENQAHEFPIEVWPHGATEPQTREIRFSFWPPGDDAMSWTCRCGRPTDESARSGGHWQWVVPVAEPHQGPLVAYGD